MLAQEAVVAMIWQWPPGCPICLTKEIIVVLIKFVMINVWLVFIDILKVFEKLPLNFILLIVVSILFVCGNKNWN